MDFIKTGQTIIYLFNIYRFQTMNHTRSRIEIYWNNKIKLCAVRDCVWLCAILWLGSVTVEKCKRMSEKWTEWEVSGDCGYPAIVAATPQIYLSIIYFMSNCVFITYAWWPSWRAGKCLQFVINIRFLRVLENCKVHNLYIRR